MSDSVVEILLEQENEEKSVTMLILDSKLFPGFCRESLIVTLILTESRKQLSENLVDIGGTPLLPGVLHRLFAEIRYLVAKSKYQKVLGTKTFQIPTPSAKANCMAWLRGANFGILQLILNGSHSVSKEYYKQTGHIPDWSPLSNSPLKMMFGVRKVQQPLR